MLLQTTDGVNNQSNPFVQNHMHQQKKKTRISSLNQYIICVVQYIRLFVVKSARVYDRRGFMVVIK